MQEGAWASRLLSTQAPKPSLPSVYSVPSVVENEKTKKKPMYKPFKG
jgi:hypothetical protein